MNAQIAISLKRKLRVILLMAAVILFSGFFMRVDGTTAAYTYDSLNRLTQATYPDGTVIAYSYDAAGNRLTQTITQVAPSITVQPQPQTALLGGTASFSVSATGSALLTYQWLFNAHPISGQISPTLSLSGVTASQAGNYSVVITNGAGTITSSTAALTVQTTFSQWQASYGISGGPTATPQNDGVSNLLKYLYDIDPTRPMNAADRATLPAVGRDTTTNPGTEYLTLTYRKNALMSGITVHLQTSSDLQTWQTVTPDINQSAGIDATTGDPIMEVGVNVNGLTQKFIRLNVTDP